ncbi:hypothetical protein XU18_0440 [Perkinsela sp. CCAP 1560/4]|nr:hypothetical protein XU18_0440 [Perkinsela sp. CCAP 1560/4]|eukprot:KNH09755.1 hypothetical protein XU18_0440 [Perkinsela sp. CCAP 1560/4]
MMKRICVLSSSYAESISDTAEYDDYICTPAHYFDANDPNYQFELVQLHKATSYRVVRSLVHSGKYDCFFNLCDGGKDEDRAGEEVVRALEEFEVPFTGADSAHFDPSKPEMKMIGYFAGINVPMHVVLQEVPTLSELRNFLEGFTFPLIVKHPHACASSGMTKRSKCNTYEEVIEQVSIFIKRIKVAMIEEFIVGDEVTVLAVQTPNGTKVLPPAQMNFPDGEEFKHFDLKWITYEGLEWFQVPENDPHYKEMMRVGEVSFETMLGGVGYGRCDLRIQRETGKVYFLEINPNCGILYPPGSESSADWILKFDKTFGHKDFVISLIEGAMQEHRRTKKIFKVNFTSKKGYHCITARDIAKDEIIFEDECQPTNIVTRPYVMQHWSPQPIKDFEAYAWPLSNDSHVYATWSEDHKKWRSINHSCDPNCGFCKNNSLNCRALRDIPAGEEITMDYATFYDEAMSMFDCHCDAPNCRSQIHVNDPTMKATGEFAWHRS